MSEKIRIGGIQELDLVDTDGIAFAIFFQGCKKRCKGCHNPELQPFNTGTETSVSEIIESIQKNIEWYDSVALLGGEPLEQPEALLKLLAEIEKLGLEVWLYTGYEIEEVPQKILSKCSVVIAGPYIESLKTGGFPASRNQVVLDQRRNSQC